MKQITVYYVVNSDGNAWLYPGHEPVFDQTTRQWRRSSVCRKKAASDETNEKNHPSPCMVLKDCERTFKDPAQRREMPYKSFMQKLNAFRNGTNII